MSTDQNLFTIIKTTRAMRRLKPDPVPDELLSRLLEAATCAPSGANRQQWRFLVVRDPAVKREIQSYYQRAYQEVMAEVYGSAEPPKEVTDEGYDRQRSAVGYLTDHLHEAPVLIIPCADNRDPEIVKAYASGRFPPHQKGASIYPAVQNLLLAARALGLGAVLTTRHLVYQEEVDAILGLPDGVESYAIVPVGYPMGNFGPVRRSSVDDVVYLDRWGCPHPPLGEHDSTTLD